MAINVEQALAASLAGASSRVAAAVAPRFKVGDRIRVRNINPPGHTRMPRYIRGHVGTIAIDHGVFVFPDSHAAGRGEQPQHVYSVHFTAPELWGPQGNPRDSMLVDVWDDYMDPAGDLPGNAG
jgi:nitrile hydratase